MGSFLASLLYENVSYEGYFFVGSIEILYYKCIQKLFNSILSYFLSTKEMVVDDREQSENQIKCTPLIRPLEGIKTF